MKIGNVQQLHASPARLNKRLRNEAEDGTVEQIRELIERGANVNAHGDDGDTPLLIAVKNKRARIADVLLDYGAHVNAADHNGVTPLMLAAKNNDAETVEVLLDYGANVNAKDKKGDTPLHYAVPHCLKIAELLENRGADIDSPNNDSVTPRRKLELYQESKNVEYSDNVSSIVALITGIILLIIVIIWFSELEDIKFIVRRGNRIPTNAAVILMMLGGWLTLKAMWHLKLKNLLGKLWDKLF